MNVLNEIGRDWQQNTLIASLEPWWGVTRKAIHSWLASDLPILWLALQSTHQKCAILEHTWSVFLAWSRRSKSSGNKSSFVVYVLDTNANRTPLEAFRGLAYFLDNYIFNLEHYLLTSCGSWLNLSLPEFIVLILKFCIRFKSEWGMGFFLVCLFVLVAF